LDGTGTQGLDDHRPVQKPSQAVQKVRPARLQQAKRRRGLSAVRWASERRETPLADFVNSLLDFESDLSFCVVGATDEWARFDVHESESPPLLFQQGKFIGTVEACDRQMLPGWL